MYRLHCFGYPMLETADGVRMRKIERYPKAFAILIYLACRGRMPCAQRATLLPVFWPDSDEVHGRNSLRQALFRLRGFLGAGVLVGRDGGEVTVEARRLHCDFWDFCGHINAGGGLAAREMSPEFFLRDFAIPDAEPFMDWIDRTRHEVVVEATKALSRVAARAEDDGDIALACTAWRQALELYPYSEHLLCRAVTAMMAQGDRAAAAQAWWRFQERLSVDLDLRPTDATGRHVRSALGLTDYQARFRFSPSRPERGFKVDDALRRGP